MRAVVDGPHLLFGIRDGRELLANLRDVYLFTLYTAELPARTYALRRYVIELLHLH
jgi:hypothetical protein